MASPFWGQVTPGTDEETCFVLMPFSPDKLTEIYEEYIKAAVEARTTLKCRRADDFYQPREIMRQVWEEINRARVIIADLTNKNPNVFYELGLAHALGKEVVLVAADLGDVPFDLRPVRTVIYKDSPAGYRDLSKRVLNALRDIGIAIK